MPCPPNTRRVSACVPDDWPLSQARGDQTEGDFIREAIQAAILKRIPKAKLSAVAKRGRPPKTK